MSKCTYVSRSIGWRSKIKFYNRNFGRSNKLTCVQRNFECQNYEIWIKVPLQSGDWNGDGGGGVCVLRGEGVQ